MADAYPLHWPDGWTRTPATKRRRSPYKTPPSTSTSHVLKELRLMGALRGTVIISTNVPVSREGTPYANVRAPEDPGVAVYWSTSTFKDRSIVCDKWDRVHDNIHAVGIALGSLRAIERAGAGQISDRAYAAFGALPPAAEASVTKARQWWAVFGFNEGMLSNLSLGVITARFRELSPKVHPDRTGSDIAMKELSLAYEQAKAYFK